MNRRNILGTALVPLLTSVMTSCASFVSKKESQRHPLADTILNRIAFGSCINEEDPQAIWQPILASKPNLFIFGGDNVYSSKQPFQLAELTKAYATLAANPGFKKLQETTPHIAIWDDHDYGINDGGASFEHKLASKQEFLRFWNVDSNDERRQREGIYRSYSYGPAGQRVQVILLDTRSFLSAWKVTDQRGAPGKERYVPDDTPDKTILGAAQWAWLEAQLHEPADVRFIVSGFQILAEGHGWERWGNFPNERTKLLRLIASTRANGVIFLSGDRHIGAFYEQRVSFDNEAKPLSYPLFELTSSGLTHTWKTANEVGPNRIGSLFTALHFGVIDLNWKQRRVSLQIRDASGDLRREIFVSM
jgi:alkaline phosphatase D